MNFLCKWVIFRFHVNFPGCTSPARCFKLQLPQFRFFVVIFRALGVMDHLGGANLEWLFLGFPQSNLINPGIGFFYSILGKKGIGIDLPSLEISGKMC